MSFESTELVDGFADDSMEHLDNIEQNLLDIEAAGKDADEDLINAVFRAAHSIKGGAGMLGFETIKELAHKLENVLHMVRSGGMEPTPEVVSVLLEGFDRLKDLISNVGDSENMPIQEQVDKLVALTSSGLPEADKGLTAQTATVDLGHERLMEVDAVSLDQARKGGNNIFLLEFDLIHDFQVKDKTPWQAIKGLQDAGRIVDCKLDFEAVGTLDSDFENRIPLYVIYATILEPEHLGGVVAIDEGRVTSIEEAREAGRVAIAEQRTFGPFELDDDKEVCLVVLPERVAIEHLGDLRLALLAGLDRCAGLALDVAGLKEADVFFFQLLCSAQRDFAAADKPFGLVGDMDEELRKEALGMGFVAEVWQGLGAREVFF